MTSFEIMQSAFVDELEKIAGELQGFTRAGRKPIGVERLLEREVESETTPTDVVEKALGTEKTSAAEEVASRLKLSPGAVKGSALVAGGALGYHVLRKANEDRKLGRQLRLQNQQ